MYTRIAAIACICLLIQPVLAQQAPDSSSGSISTQEVVVTATRDTQALEKLPLPITLISGKAIQRMGAQRLGEVLLEQPGLVVGNAGFNLTGPGALGVQLQGLSPDYTLILIDGEPVIGRSGGFLDLERLTVGNVSRVEIVKGPASILYGSEALAGVINIITQPNTHGFTADASLRAASNNTYDANVGLQLGRGAWSGRVFYNRNQTQGYDLFPETDGQTVYPKYSNTYTGRLQYVWGSRAMLALSARSYEEAVYPFNQQGTVRATEVATLGNTSYQRDWSLYPSLTWYVLPNLKIRTTLYASQYSANETSRHNAVDTLYYENHFSQRFTRPEVIIYYSPIAPLKLTAGAGYIAEHVTRALFGSTLRTQRTRYAFLQSELQLGTRATLIGGLRWDENSSYGAQLSPKLATRYALGQRWNLQASIGVGFKAPDFRQLYFDFANPFAPYTLIGAADVASYLQALLNNGSLQPTDLYFPLATLGNLRAESSVSYNLGARYRTDKFSLDVNLFLHDVKDLITSATVAYSAAAPNRQYISYRNVDAAFFGGLDLETRWDVSRNLRLSGSYQFLQTGDWNIWRGIQRSEVVVRNPAGDSRPLQLYEYTGLPERSRHTGTFKITYQAPKLGTDANLRVIYRGSFFARDVNGNNVADPELPEETTGGYTLVNLAVGQKLKHGFYAQAGLDNILDQKNPTYLPFLAGRLWFVRLSYRFSTNA